MTESPTTALTPLTEKQEATIYSPEQEWSDDFALKIAVQDFNAAEVFRNQNHDWRWRTHFSLYEGYCEQKMWEGTRIPRSSLPIYLCFEQVESMLPKILSAIFSDQPWFQADPGPGTTAAEAREVRDLLLTQMDQTGVREVFRRWIKSGLIHGNGIMGLSWLQRDKKIKKYVSTYQQQFQTLSLGEQQLQIPMGFRRMLEMKFEEMLRKFGEGEIPVPSFWGGYRVAPRTIEFWQGGPHRLHDRFLYTRDETGWQIARLAP